MGLGGAVNMAKKLAKYCIQQWLWRNGNENKISPHREEACVHCTRSATWTTQEIEEQMQHTGTPNPCSGCIFSLSVMQRWNKMYELHKFSEMSFSPRKYRYFFSLYRYKM